MLQNIKTYTESDQRERSAKRERERGGARAFCLWICVYSQPKLAEIHFNSLSVLSFGSTVFFLLSFLSVGCSSGRSTFIHICDLLLYFIYFCSTCSQNEFKVVVACCVLHRRFSALDLADVLALVFVFHYGRFPWARTLTLILARHNKPTRFRRRTKTQSRHWLLSNSFSNV